MILREKIGIIGGTNLYKKINKISMKLESIDTPYGKTSSPIFKMSIKNLKIPLMIRHGVNYDIPPHKINHAANLWALKNSGIDYIIGISSAGSLRIDFEPPSLIIPEDFFSPFTIPTIFNKEIKHITPALNDELRDYLIKAAEKSGVRYHSTGVYIQTKGPRLESKAEIKVMSKWGDVVGMSMASEATIAQELDLKFASICSIDNYANGISDVPPSFKEILTYASKNWEMIEKVLFILFKDVLGV